MKKILILVVVVISLGGVYYTFLSPNDIPKNPPVIDTGTNNTNTNTTNIQEHFIKELQYGVVNRVGQPIEGFMPEMFMLAFSGIIPQDFDGIDAFSGKYKVIENKLVFIEDNSPIRSSADGAISTEGMKAIFSNIQRRINFLIATIDDVDNLLISLGTAQNTKVTECLPEQRDVDACIEIYQPVCGTVNVQCVTTPCDPLQETFGNSCKACSNPLVSSYIEGKCLVGQ